MDSWARCGFVGLVAARIVRLGVATVTQDASDRGKVSLWRRTGINLRHNRHNHGREREVNRTQNCSASFIVCIIVNHRMMREALILRGRMQIRRFFERRLKRG
jgi:hypothetical protein